MSTDESLIPPEQLTLEKLAEIFSEEGPLVLGTESGPEVILPREPSKGAQHSCPASSLHFGSVGADTTNHTPNPAPTAAHTNERPTS